MEARLIGRMILARWLDYPPERYENLVEMIAGSKIFRQMARRIEVVHLPGTLAPDDGSDGSSTAAVARLIPLESRGRTCAVSSPKFAIAYRHPAWGREFRVDGCLPAGGDPADPDVDWLLRQLRPVNTRNRLTHLVLHSVLEAQAAFLRSGAWANLEPQTLAGLSRRLAGAGEDNAPSRLPPGLETLDASILSRAVRGFTLNVPQGGDLPLRLLLPSSRAALRYRLKALLDGEEGELRNGTLQDPRRDDELHREVQARWGQQVSRRTVAAARQSLGIPASYARAGLPVYPPPGFDFSPAHPLTSGEILAHAPPGPGVYEIALAGEVFQYPARASSSIYIGQSGNLRNRLRAHLHNRKKFGPMPGNGRLDFRFAVIHPAHLRRAEARLVEAFRQMYGALPRRNLNTPSGG